MVFLFTLAYFNKLGILTHGHAQWAVNTRNIFGYHNFIFNNYCYEQWDIRNMVCFETKFLTKNKIL